MEGTSDNKIFSLLGNDHISTPIKGRHFWRWMIFGTSPFGGDINILVPWRLVFPNVVVGFSKCYGVRIFILPPKTNSPVHLKMGAPLEEEIPNSKPGHVGQPFVFGNRTPWSPKTKLLALNNLVICDAAMVVGQKSQKIFHPNGG